MRILVYGAGVIGSELAHTLCKKNDVTLLARGKRKEDIDGDGLVIRHYVQRKTTVDRLKTIDVLETDDEYDLIFVVMQAGQLEQVIPSIALNTSRHIVFVGNNMSAKDTEKKLPEKEIAFGFQGTAGRREEETIISVHAGLSLTIGGSDHPLSEEFQDKLDAAFEKTGMKPAFENRMDAWLKCHAAAILPLVCICYINDGNLKKADRRLRKAVLDAIKEGYGVLQKLGYPILPKGDEKWFSGFRRPFIAAMYFFIYKTPIGRLSLSDHAMHAVDEMRYLDEEFEKLIKKADIETPYWNGLRKEAEERLNSLDTESIR